MKKILTSVMILSLGSPVFAQTPQLAAPDLSISPVPSLPPASRSQNPTSYSIVPGVSPASVVLPPASRSQSPTSYSIAPGVSPASVPLPPAVARELIGEIEKKMMVSQRASGLDEGQMALKSFLLALLTKTAEGKPVGESQVRDMFVNVLDKAMSVQTSTGIDERKAAIKRYLLSLLQGQKPEMAQLKQMLVDEIDKKMVVPEGDKLRAALKEYFLGLLQGKKVDMSTLKQLMIEELDKKMVVPQTATGVDEGKAALKAFLIDSVKKAAEGGKPVDTTQYLDAIITSFEEKMGEQKGDNATLKYKLLEMLRKAAAGVNRVK